MRYYFLNTGIMEKQIGRGRYYLQIQDTLEFAADFWNYKWVDWDRIAYMHSTEGNYDGALIEQVNLSKEYKDENN